MAMSSVCCERFIGINLTTPQIWQHAQALLDQLAARGFQSGHDGTRRNRMRAARTPLPGLSRPEMVCIAKRIARSMERPGVPARPSDELKRAWIGARKEIWCVLNERDGGIRLVQRPRKTSLMPGMWELPQSSEPPRPLPARRPGARFAIPSPSPTTLFMCYGICRYRSAYDPPPAAKGKWIAIDRIPQIPITGLDAENPEGRRHHLIFESRCGVRHFLYEVARSLVRRSERYGCIAGRNQST